MKKNNDWVIVHCSSGYDCIRNIYEIEIRLKECRADKPKVFETGNRIKKLSEKLGKPIIDLHVYPNDEDCCLGLFWPNEMETLSKFVLHKVYPYFV